MSFTFKCAFFVLPAFVFIWFWVGLLNGWTKLDVAQIALIEVCAAIVEGIHQLFQLDLFDGNC